jgi:uncharacterized protein YqhQ
MRGLTRRLVMLAVAQENVLLGGQAVLEGVMMRSPSGFAVAVRRPDGEVAYLAETAPAWTARHRLLKLPVLRGVVTLFQSLALGLRALNFSSETAFPEEHRKKDGTAPAADGTMSGATWLSLALALVLGIGLFFLLPLAATEGIHRLWPALGQGVRYNLVEGLIRGVIFLLYIWGIGLAPDIRRLFRYHGAEHKVVHAFEARGGMDVATVQTFTTLHPRCGTSFLLFVMVVSILVFSFIPGWWPTWGKALSRILLLPLVAGLSYELIRFSARRRNAVTRALVAPGLLMQKLTTAPPDDGMVEIALAAFHKAADLEGGREALVL